MQARNGTQNKYAIDLKTHMQALVVPKTNMLALGRTQNMEARDGTQNKYAVTSWHTKQICKHAK